MMRVLLMVVVMATPALAADDDSTDALLEKVRRALDARDYEAALSAADRLVKAAPDSARMHALRGSLSEQVRRFESALEAYDRALQLEPENAEWHDRRGGVAFKLGRIDESLAAFDRAITIDPRRFPYHWQRGISLYYARRYDDGREQFESHQTVNSNDVENAVWHFLCVARLRGAEEARKRLIPIAGDPRVPMAEVHALFRGQGTPEQVLAAAEADTASPEAAKRQRFYAHLYLGLYHEALGQSRRTRRHIEKAAREFLVPHYMGDVARVHLQMLERADAATQTPADPRP